MDRGYIPVFVYLGIPRLQGPLVEENCNIPELTRDKLLFQRANLRLVYAIQEEIIILHMGQEKHLIFRARVQ